MRTRGRSPSCIPPHYRVVQPLRRFASKRGEPILVPDLALYGLVRADTV